MMTDLGLSADEAEARADTLRTDGKTAMFVAVEGALAGIVAVADPIKETTAAAIHDLHALGLTIIMATCDNRRSPRRMSELP